MGCISSKVVTRSRSFQEEMSLSLQRRTNGMPGLEDLLANKSGGGDQLIALLCTANTVAAKLRVGNAAQEHGKSSPRPTEPERDKNATAASTTAADEPVSPETINAWELMADLEQEDEEEEQERPQHQQQHLLQHPQEITHSSSLLKNDDGEVPTTKNLDSAEGSYSVGKAGESVARSRSFRTVEDFDAMVTGNSPLLVRREASGTSGRDVEAWLEESHGISSKEYPPESSEHVQVVDASREQDNKEGQQTTDGNAHEATDRPDGSDCSGINVKPELRDVHPTAWSRSSSTRESASSEGNNNGGNRSFPEQRSLRRRAMAKELETLKVPSFEFSSVGSLREWLGSGGQVFSPGSYVTPKFGGFGSQAAAADKSGDAGCEETPFDPQMVADLEEAMERLTMEEEHILRQIVESLQGSYEEDAER